MKPTQTRLIKKIISSRFFALSVIDIMLLALFRYYQPLCEPCIDTNDCPPCLSKQQYFILYFSLAVNLAFGMYYLFKKIKNDRKT